MLRQRLDIIPNRWFADRHGRKFICREQALVNPEQLIKEVRHRRDCHPFEEALGVYWVTLSGDRDDFATSLRRLRGTFPLVPTILRSSGRFRDSNALMNDVAVVLEETQDEILGLAKAIRQYNGAEIVILSRTELRLISTSSPIVLPDWYPITPGHTVTARIQDLTWDINVSMADEVAMLADLQRLLYEIDRALEARLRQCHKADHRYGQALWDSIRRDTGQSFYAAMDEALETLGTIENPANFRPSAKRNKTVIERLWLMANGTPPDKMAKRAKALARAVRTDEIQLSNHRQSLLAVLNRPTNPINDLGTLWCFQLIGTLRSACQFVTAAAHADEYPSFPDTLLKAASLDIRRFLDSATAILRQAGPEVGAR